MREEQPEGRTTMIKLLQLHWRVILAIGGLTALAACTSVEPRYMAANDLAPAYRHPYKVNVQIARYADQSHITDHGLTPEVILEAIRISIQSTGLFKAVVPANEADYTLSLVVHSILPKFQMGPTVWYMSIIEWKLTENASGREAYSRKIVYAKTSTFAGRGRGVTAQEGAFRGNIWWALHDIGSFDIRSESKQLPPFEKGKDSKDPTV